MRSLSGMGSPLDCIRMHGADGTAFREVTVDNHKGPGDEAAIGCELV